MYEDRRSQMTEYRQSALRGRIGPQKSASVYERVRFTWTENAQTFELVPRSLTFAKHYRETLVTADCR